MRRPPTLHLYSGSPRRQELLNSLGVPFKVLPVHADESIPAGRSSESVVADIAGRKLRAGIRSFDSDGSVWGLAADTLVEGPSGLMGKPGNEKEAVEMLRALSGITHRVYTGIAVYSPLKQPGGETRVLTNCTKVSFRKLTEKDLEVYIRSGEWKGVAGAYRIQEKGAFLLEKIEGLWSTVVGLPLSPLYGILSAMSYPFG